MILLNGFCNFKQIPKNTPILLLWARNWHAHLDLAVRWQQRAGEMPVPSVQAQGPQAGDQSRPALLLLVRNKVPCHEEYEEYVEEEAGLHAHNADLDWGFHGPISVSLHQLVLVSTEYAGYLFVEPCYVPEVMKATGSTKLKKRVLKAHFQGAKMGEYM